MQKPYTRVRRQDQRTMLQHGRMRYRKETIDQLVQFGENSRKLWRGVLTFTYGSAALSTLFTLRAGRRRLCARRAALLPLPLNVAKHLVPRRERSAALPTGMLGCLRQHRRRRRRRRRCCWRRLGCPSLLALPGGGRLRARFNVFEEAVAGGKWCTTSTACVA